jgi:hypothetical protein
MQHSILNGNKLNTITRLELRLSAISRSLGEQAAK